ncbi:fec operon regulator FecR [compost metagenome]
MSEISHDGEREALGWLVRVNDPGFAAWDEWEAWLARDSHNADAYWRFAAEEAEATEALQFEAARSGTVFAASRRRAPTRRYWLAAVAAAAAAAAAGVWMWHDRPRTWQVETAPGEQRTLVLADGTALHLDGATQITMDRSRPRYVALERGRFLVEVVHDEQRPFSVVVGDAVLTDLGTAFDVTRLEDGLRVAVSEGVVRVDVGPDRVTLRPGEGLVAREGRLTRRSVPAAEVDAWREGRLVYEDERYAVVIEDLARVIGQPVRLAPELADRRFTGSIGVQGSRDALRPRLEALLGVSITSEGDAWRVAAAARP